MTTPTDQAQIAQLWIHPIKSCGAVSVRQAHLLPTGLEWDREWMLVDAQGHFVTQRECPSLARVQPRMGHEEWILKAPGMLSLHLNAWAYEGETQVEIWGDEVPALDMGTVAAQWFNDYLAQEPASQAWLKQNGPMKLVRTHPDHLRQCDAQWTGEDRSPVGFADGFGLLVTSVAALEDFNRRMQAAGHAAVDMRRFRPNVVLGGLPPHGEDDLKAFHWTQGEQTMTVRLTKPCPRCSIPEVNPDTGEPGRGVTSVLSSYRSDQRLKGALTFGMNGYWQNPWPADSEDFPLLTVGDVVSLDFGF
ncbi:MAG: MOSC domain-containing protein [Betaproteobacteria bacterium]|nr:MOSC domain-containing protein [Betaproteobacteria bacterium]